MSRSFPSRRRVVPRRSTRCSVARHDTRNVTRSGRFSRPGDRRRRGRRQRVRRRRRLERRRGRARARARRRRARRCWARRAMTRGRVRATRRGLRPWLGRLSAARSETWTVACTGERSDRAERDEKKVTAGHLQVRERALQTRRALVLTSGGRERLSLRCREGRRRVSPPDAYQALSICATSGDAAGRACCRPRDRVPTKIPMVTARTATWPMSAPEQPAMAMGASAARYQGVSFIPYSPRGLRASCTLHVRQATTFLGAGKTSIGTGLVESTKKGVGIPPHLARHIPCSRANAAADLGKRFPAFRRPMAARWG